YESERTTLPTRVGERNVSWLVWWAPRQVPQGLRTLRLWSGGDTLAPPHGSTGHGRVPPSPSPCAAQQSPAQKAGEAVNSWESALEAWLAWSGFGLRPIL